MGILDDPCAFYAPPQEDWSLGDVVIVPTIVLWSRDEKPPGGLQQPAPPPDGSDSVVYALWSGADVLPSPVAECWVTPAIVVADDCVLDKEFNAFVERRIGEGVPEDEAVAEARADTTLDPIVPVVPILPYRSLRFAGEPSVRQGQAIGYFPIVESTEVDAGYVDFTRVVPVSRHLLFGPAAALSEPARRILRWKLAQYYALRNLSVDREIAAAIGKAITDVRAVVDNKHRLVVDLELDHGRGEIRLRQEPRRADLPAGYERGRPAGSQPVGGTGREPA